MKETGLRRERRGKSKSVPEREAHPAEGWLLFFYSVPSEPVKNRMKVWRKLTKMGAAQLKGSVYIIPYGEENYEMLQWLVSEVASMGGEAAFIRTTRIESMGDGEVVELFDRAREKDYQAIERKVDELETRLASVRKGSRIKLGSIADRIDRLAREFEEIRKIDFFTSAAGESLGGRIEALRKETAALAGHEGERPEVSEIAKRDIADYQGKTWITRPKPFVDRMATAWLIKRFVDREAVFGFMEEKDLKLKSGDAVSFDIQGGDLTHLADMCTFEVVMRSFDLKDRALRKLAELVHELDLKDGKFDSPEARGVEGVLRGVRKTAKNDAEMLEKGMEVFDMLYVSKA
ncbi:MAG: chromate resistance protein [Nitrospirota bacterium]|jgi:hypothetical protein